MSRIPALVVALVMLVSAAPLAGPVASGAAEPTSSISITNLSVSPSSPAPGERITIEPTIKNLENSESNVQIDSVYVRQKRRGSFTELTRVRKLGGLNPGSDISIPLSVTFDDPGSKRLRVVVNAVNEDGDRIRVNAPVTVDVTEQHPQLDVDVNDSVASERARGTISVANGLDAAAKNVEVTLSSDRLDFSNARSVHPTIAAGETASTTFHYEADSGGTYRIAATLNYRIDGSQTRTVTETTEISVESLRRNVVVQASQPGSGASAVTVDVQNRGNVAIENVTVAAESTNATIPQRFIGRIDAQSSRSMTLNASLSEPRATVTVDATYDVADESARQTDQVELRSSPGRIDLTGIDVAREEGKLHITGSASNIGLTQANSVVVSVVGTDTVTPAAPTREYFVGRVPESDFVSFDVYATTEDNVTSVPLEVSYLVDGERHKRTVDVAVEPVESTDRTQPNRDGSGGLVIPALGGVVALGVGAIIFTAWRNSSGGA